MKDYITRQFFKDVPIYAYVLVDLMIEKCKEGECLKRTEEVSELTAGICENILFWVEMGCPGIEATKEFINKYKKI